MSVSLPPNQVPTTEPKPKKDIIQPTCGIEKLRLLLRYNDKNGITIVPALLIKVINDNHQTSLDSPLNVFM